MYTVVYVKSNRISYEFSGLEHHGNAVKKAKGTLTLRKLKVDVLTVQKRGPRLSMLHSSEVLNLNNLLNIKY